MVVLITFLEGVLSFLSPCMLPLLPVYLSYFAGGGEGRGRGGRILAFICGFTLSFMVLGLTLSALLLLVYSLGLGIPFALSALLMGRLDVFFKAVKEHYDVVERISGGLLILAGILTATGVMGRWMRLFS